MTLDPDALGRKAEAMLRKLGAISAEPGRLVRLFLTPEHRRSADMVASWMREAGLDVSEDALATVRGRWGEGPRLLIGSHIDTVIHAGMYDGPLGVVAGILAVEALRLRGVTLPFGIDVLAFGDEEGSRFPATMSGSAACAGLFAPSALASADAGGVTLDAALRAYGCDPAAIPAAAYRREDVRGYVEVHIEQGPVLETQAQALGIVSGIVGQSRLRVAVMGEAGHAGTVPMPLRRDALAGAAEMIMALERMARDADISLVATAGRIEAAPGAVNIIPGHVDFTVDIRCLSDEARRAALGRWIDGARAIAERRGLGFMSEVFYETAATACDPALQAGLEAAIRAVGGGGPRLPSGAGHDAQMMARLCPVAMLFVRCRGGVSHNPAEYAAPDDIGRAIAALVLFIEGLAATG